MSFGKLTITTESGQIEEFELTRPTTSVGRQPGNDIVLPTAAVSRYHAQFDAAEGQVFLVDLGTVNGSFVNDQQVEVNGRVALKDGDVVQLGDVRMIFTSPQQPHGTGPLSLNPTEHVDARVAIKLVLDDPRAPVAPGAFLQFAMVVENHSNQERMFRIEADGMDQTWIRVNRHEIRLSDSEKTEVLISVRPPRASTTRPGRYPLRIRVAPQDDPSQVVEVLREVDVLGYSGMAMAMKRGRQPGQYFLAVQNQGNHPLELELGGYQAHGLLRFHFTPSRLMVEPGQTQQVALRINPTKALPPERRVSFAVVAHALDLSGYRAPLLGHYSSRKTSSAGWLAGLVGLPILAVIGILALIIVIGGLMYLAVIPAPSWLTFGAQTAARPIAITATLLPASATPPPTAIPTPVVNLVDFTASPGEAVFGTIDMVVFTWQIDHPGNVKTYVLKENSTGTDLPLDVAAPSIARFEIEAATLVAEYGWDAHDYTLTITGIDGVERSSTVRVKISPVTCSALPAAEVYDQPAQSGGTPVPIPESKEVVIGGRTMDGKYLLVWSLGEHSPLGWMRTEGVKCPLTPSLEEYIVVTPAAPLATNTASG